MLRFFVFLLFLAVAGMLIKQPDIGMAAVVAIVWFGQFFMAGLRLYWLVAGAVAGLAVTLLEWRVSPRMAVTGRMVAGFVTVVSCAIAQLGIAPRIAAIRALSGGSLDSLPAGDARRVAFARLHGLSVLWLAIAALAALIALVLAVRAQRRES